MEPGKSAIRLYCEIIKNTVSASVRFDDVFLHITPASQTGGLPATPDTPAILVSPQREAKPWAAAPGIEWVHLPGGAFMMGAENWPDAGPVHAAKIEDF